MEQYAQLISEAFACHQKGDLARAETLYQDVIENYPHQSQPRRFLGLVYFQQQKYLESLPFLESACQLAPGDKWSHYSLGSAYVWCGLPEQAVSAFERCLALDESFHRARFAWSMAHIPMMYESQSQISIWRDKYSESLLSLADYYSRASVEQQNVAADIVGINQPYNLAYQASDDRHLQSVYGKLICNLMNTRYPQYCSELKMPELSLGQPIRVGILSPFFREHSNWKMPIQGWVENLDRRRFEVYCYHASSAVDENTRHAMQRCKAFVQGLTSLEEWANRILSDRLHVLLIPGLGMDVMIAKLACLRLAPIQCNGVGHPVTSGCATMDYYLSSDYMEPSGADEHYSESLVRLPKMGVHYTPTNKSTTGLTREAFGIAPESMVYCCCQTLYKYLPRYDYLFARIAVQVPNALFLFLRHRSELVTQKFSARLEVAFRENGLDWRRFCVILPRLSTHDFNGLLEQSHVFLDSLDWNGMNTVIEAIHYGIPIVTLPGKFMRGRHAQAILRMMDVTDTIANDEEHYLEIATQLGNDPVWRDSLRKKIIERKQLAYSDLSCVEHLQEFLERTVIERAFIKGP